MSGWLTNGMSLATLPITGNERFPVDTQLTAGAAPEMEAVSFSQLGMAIGGGFTIPWVAGRFYGNTCGNTPTGVLPVTGTFDAVVATSMFYDLGGHVDGALHYPLQAA